jgi:hypothetical protein
MRGWRGRCWEGSCEDMKQLDHAGGSPMQNKKICLAEVEAPRERTRKRDVPPEPKVAQTEPSPLAPVSRQERTRRLILAALRVWELKWRIRD